MPRCPHDLRPLIEPPTDLVGGFTLALRGLAGYVVCQHCGRVGYYRRSRRAPLAWMPLEAGERLKRKAEEWKEWNEKRLAEETLSQPQQEE